ncbi:MAG TPA: hypothetical protein DCQ64_09265 [Candidatus Rokubacteria bacterium]|nr:hypothetical protein [Candidatus Rokubacteria bacterium]
MSKQRVLNLFHAEADDRDCQVLSNRVVLTLHGNPKESGYTQVVHLHISWESLPWVMRKLWAAWWRHRTEVVRRLDWIEGELKGSGVERP